MSSMALLLLPWLAAQDAATHHLYTLGGDVPADRFGASVAGAGDVNGDGFADVIVGAPHGPAGLARVFSGADGTVLFTFRGSGSSDWFGFAVGGVGDVDGDGFADLVVGAPLADRTDVFSGRDGALLLTWNGVAAGDRFGQAVCGLGDVDGDGFPDVAIGAPHGDSSGLNAGCVKVYSGCDGRLLDSYAGSAGDFLGSSVSAARDADGDGFADVLVGAPLADVGAFNSGSAFVYAGSTGAVLHAFHGAQIGDQLGNWTAGAGDVDGDGMPDFILGVPGADAAGIDSGAAEVRAGSDGSVLFVVSGSSSGEYLGSVASAGDVDGDGRADVIVGAASSDAGGNEAGTVRVVSGASGLDLVAFHGGATFDWLGAAVACVGDVNGDGWIDFAAGAPGHDDVPTKLGYVQVLSGTALSLASDVHALPLAAGGSQMLTLAAPSSLAGFLFAVLGSAAGTTPGIPVDGLLLPLAFEPFYFTFTALHPALGALDAQGGATVVVSVPPGSPPALAGLVLHHAYLVVDAAGTAVFTSNATPLALE